MILKKYKKEKTMTKEEKSIQKQYEQHCVTVGSYDHMTDKELEKKYRKDYLLQ